MNCANKTEPRFKVGDRVFYKAKKKTGEVIGIININDADDIENQGFRYIVNLSDKNNWSIPESSLRSNIRGKTK